ELVDFPLLRAVAATGKPVIMSTGMAAWEELREAVATLETAGCRELALLKCVSSYPATPAEMNLRNIPLLASKFHVPIGLSDHTLGTDVAVASVALGACLVEKHLTLSRAAGGPDASFSLEPKEFRQLVESVRSVEQALGSNEYRVSPREAANRKLRRSLYLTADVPAGAPLEAGQIQALRPAEGLPPRYLSQVLGRRARRDLLRGTPLTWDLLEPVPEG
ncbi:MAG: N-acetylneuraminate synthase family protein, partial [Planctomycetaceae bacterium]|nr:N-acetylneuraminate synthase family protein [Planctomycetaceae bacterium]